MEFYICIKWKHSPAFRDFMSPDQSPSPPTVPIFSKNKSKQQFINGNRFKECGYLNFFTLKYDRIEPVKKTFLRGRFSSLPRDFTVLLWTNDTDSACPQSFSNVRDAGFEPGTTALALGSLVVVRNQRAPHLHFWFYKYFLCTVRNYLSNMTSTIIPAS